MRRFTEPPPACVCSPRDEEKREKTPYRNDNVNTQKPFKSIRKPILLLPSHHDQIIWLPFLFVAVVAAHALQRKRCHFRPDFSKHVDVPIAAAASVPITCVKAVAYSSDQIADSKIQSNL